jgi:hypothetical protein
MTEKLGNNIHELQVARHDNVTGCRALPWEIGVSGQHRPGELGELLLTTDASDQVSTPTKVKAERDSLSEVVTPCSRLGDPPARPGLHGGRSRARDVIP